jgi:uncharacterized protein (TIGR03067 family)
MYSSFLVGLALTIGAPTVKDPPNKDAPSIVGEWIGETAISGGKQRPAPEKGFVMKFSADGTLSLKDDGRDRPDVPYKLDAKKTPAEIDIVPPKGEETMIGIYKIEGDTLTICLTGGKDAARPTKFESPEGAMTVLITLKRAKK